MADQHAEYLGNKIDTHLVLSGSVWWEPLGAYGESGKSRNMYDDYSASKKVRTRMGTAFTRSREELFESRSIQSREHAERMWLNAELFEVDRAPYSGAFTPYTAGITGWVPMLQTVLAF